MGFPHDRVLRETHASADLGGAVSLGPERAELLDGLCRPADVSGRHHAASRNAGIGNRVGRQTVNCLRCVLGGKIRMERAQVVGCPLRVRRGAEHFFRIVS